MLAGLPLMDGFGLTREHAFLPHGSRANRSPNSIDAPIAFMLGYDEISTKEQ
jgi:hypothetical protein